MSKNKKVKYDKRKIALILEIIPIVSSIVSFVLVTSKYDSAIISWIISISFLFSILGFAFFLIGRKLVKDDKTIKILGVFDCISTLYVVVFYILAILSFGL